MLYLPHHVLAVPNWEAGGNHHVLIAGFCKQQLWPLFHYSLPFSPSSLGRYDSELWQAYVKANKVRGCQFHINMIMQTLSVYQLPCSAATHIAP